LFGHYDDIADGKLRALDGDDIVVWLPGEFVTTHSLSVPPVARKKWQAMAPWMLEEQLLEKPDELVFRFGEKARDNSVPVLVVNRRQLELWQQRLEADLPTYRSLVPDYFALPWQQGEISLGISASRCLLRYGQWQGSSGSVDFIAPLVAAFKPAQVSKVTVYYEGERPDLQLPAELEVTYQRLPNLLHPSHRDWLAVGENLRGSGSGWSLPAKVAAVLVVVLAGLLTATAKVENNQLAAQVDGFEAELRQGYRQYFREPYDFAMKDFQRVVSARLESGANSGGVAAAFGRLDGWLAGCSDCRIEELNITDGNVVARISGGSAGKVLQGLSRKGDGVSVREIGDAWQLSYPVEGRGNG